MTADQDQSDEGRKGDSCSLNRGVSSEGRIGEAYWCNKCGYRGPDRLHQRPNGSECSYLGRVATASPPTVVPDRISRDVEQCESADRWSQGVPFKSRWERKLYEAGFSAGWDRARAVEAERDSIGAGQQAASLDAPRSNEKDAP